MKYFAYGSNLSLSRLKERAPGAERVSIFSLKEHDLRFHKASKDGSGKCDAFYTGNSDDCVIGSLFEISSYEKKALDKFEGLGDGYEEKIVIVLSQSGEEVEATTYYATSLDETLKPFSWYKNHVLVGAKESRLPAQYIEKIECVESIQDPDKIRDAEQRAIHN